MKKLLCILPVLLLFAVNSFAQSHYTFYAAINGEGYEEYLMGPRCSIKLIENSANDIVITQGSKVFGIESKNGGLFYNGEEVFFAYDGNGNITLRRGPIFLWLMPPAGCEDKSEIINVFSFPDTSAANKCYKLIARKYRDIFRARQQKEGCKQ